MLAYALGERARDTRLPVEFRLGQHHDVLRQRHAAQGPMAGPGPLVGGQLAGGDDDQQVNVAVLSRRSPGVRPEKQYALRRQALHKAADNRVQELW